MARSPWLASYVCGVRLPTEVGSVGVDQRCEAAITIRDLSQYISINFQANQDRTSGIDLFEWMDLYSVKTGENSYNVER